MTNVEKGEHSDGKKFYFYVISFLCIGIFLFASRDKKNIG